MFAFLSTYKLALEIMAIFALVSAVSLGVHNYLKGVDEAGYNRAVAEFTASSEKVKADAQKRENELNKQVEDARNEAIEREKVIIAQSDIIMSSSTSLHDQINTIRSGLSGSTLNAAINTANTSLQLFNDCQSKYRDLAVAADRNVSDEKTLIAAWPK